MPYYMAAMRRLLGPTFSERLKLMAEKVPEDEQPVRVVSSTAQILADNSVVSERLPSVESRCGGTI